MRPLDEVRVGERQASIVATGGLVPRTLWGTVTVREHPDRPDSDEILFFPDGEPEETIYIEVHPVPGGHCIHCGRAKNEAEV